MIEHSDEAFRQARREFYNAGKKVMRICIHPAVSVPVTMSRLSSFGGLVTQILAEVGATAMAVIDSKDPKTIDLFVDDCAQQVTSQMTQEIADMRQHIDGFLAKKRRS